MAIIDYSKFLGSGVVAFTSQAGVDFMKGAREGASEHGLTDSQREVLVSAGIDRPESVIFPKQVHGDVIWRVTSKEAGMRGVVEADAVMTDVLGLPIAVRTADCLPLLLLDPVRRAVAAVHAGWKSAHLEIARKTLEEMIRVYGVKPGDVRAAIGPCIRRRSYQVGSEFKTYFPKDVTEMSGSLWLDLAAANIRQLTEAGVRRDSIFDGDFCSFEDAARFHSFRRDADASGRMINLIMMR